MKKNYFIIMIILSLNYSYLFSQDLTQESYNRYVGTSKYIFEIDGRGQLEMDNIRGDVSIEGSPGNTIQIVEKITIKTSSKGKAQENFERIKAEVTSTKDKDGKTSVSISGGHWEWRRHISTEYVITLPRTSSILVNVRGGDIKIINIQGEIELSTSGGDLLLSDLAGKISATTSGGDIDIEDISGLIFLHTSGGDIEVINLEGKLNAKTSGGDIDIEIVKGDVSVNTSGGDITLEDIVGKEITARTSGGDIRVKDIIGETDVTTSGGDIILEYIKGEVEASTSGGDIEMEDIVGSIRVWTNGGSIEGKDLAGAIDARTSAGDIYIEKIWDRELLDHSIDLKTSAGDIELTLPADFPGDFSLKASNPPGKASYAITSDFPLMITASTHTARAKGKTGNGEYRIDIQSNIGTITIKQED